MPKKPKTYYSDDHEFQRLSDEYAPYLNHPHVPTESTSGIIRALLEHLSKSNPRLNVEAAEGHLMAVLLYDNGVLEEAKRRLEDDSTKFETAEQKAKAYKDFAYCLSKELSPARVERVLKEYSGHSTDQMRDESDEILKVLETTPRNKRTKTDWLNAILPHLLQSLKKKHACFKGCRGNSTWPPMKKGKSGKEVVDEDTVQKISEPKEGSGFASIKNEILAYVHGLDADSVRRYLEGKRPKTVSRPSLPRS